MKNLLKVFLFVAMLALMATPAMGMLIWSGEPTPGDGTILEPYDPSITNPDSPWIDDYTYVGDSIVDPWGYLLTWREADTCYVFAEDYLTDLYGTGDVINVDWGTYYEYPLIKFLGGPDVIMYAMKTDQQKVLSKAGKKTIARVTRLNAKMTEILNSGKKNTADKIAKLIGKRNKVLNQK